MAEINADVQDVFQLLRDEIGELKLENAVLISRLKNAGEQIDVLTKETGDDSEGSDSPAEDTPTRRRTPRAAN